ncbi:CoA-binding protein [Haliangium sp.]|uniref:CoA-binding protein n=1 Tax=Haliangium sp. TaxID=2663208 RepID=UPI003D0C1764
MTTHETISDFLACKRIAFVGLSTNPKDFSRAVAKEFMERGYDVVPVNHHAHEIGGKTCHARVQDIPEPVDAAFIMTPADGAMRVIRDCIEAGITRVWLHRGAGIGSFSDEAVVLCEAHDIAVVPGQCPLMFLDHPAWPHRVHAWGKKVIGTYPS